MGHVDHESCVPESSLISQRDVIRAGNVIVGKRVRHVALVFNCLEEGIRWIYLDRVCTASRSIASWVL